MMDPSLATLGVVSGTLWRDWGPYFVRYCPRNFPRVVCSRGSLVVPRTLVTLAVDGGYHATGRIGATGLVFIMLMVMLLHALRSLVPAMGDQKGVLAGSSCLTGGQRRYGL